jgi:chorismate dehydratase
MNPSVRVAAVRYLHTSPLVEGLDRTQGIELIPTVPSNVVTLLKESRADIGLASVVDAARNPGLLSLLSCGMIGCDGPTLTVRVYSAVPFGAITTLHADTDSHTSVILARVLLRHLYGVDPKVVAFHARERVAVASADAPALNAATPDGWPEAVLLIGDKVVADPPPADRYPHQIDLGEAWHAWTGLPFVYALWMCRTLESGSERTRLAAALLDRQRRHNAMRLSWIIASRAPEHRWPTDVAANYLGSLLRYEVGPREREAVARFYQEAARAGLLPEVSPPWADALP